MTTPTIPAVEMPAASIWRFILPSLVGVLFFLLPVRFDGSYTILMGVLTELANAAIGDAGAWVVITILTVSAIVTPLVSWFRIDLLSSDHPWRHIVDVETPWVLLRMVGALCAWLIHFQLGPQWLWHESTGGVALYDLAAAIVTLFFFAAFLLPFLTDYGFMEFVGTSCRGVFRRIFNLPGRSAIDATASWLAAAAVGILITSQQYQRGYYSAREAAVIATNFSITSLPFCLFTTEFIGLGHMFITVYGCVFVLGVIAAIIVPRLPPLSRIPDDYFPGVGKQVHESTPEGQTLLQHAVQEATQRAATGPGPRRLVQSAIGNVLDIWFGLLPAVVAVAMAGMAIAEFTPIMRWISWPFIPVLELLQLPEAATAAPTMVVGFLDMFLPAALGQAIESELTRFVVCCVSLTQLIYMSEVGVLLLKSPLPLNFWNLVQIFFIRTLLMLPLAALAGHMIY
ncbi:MAG: YjiH family protein [Gammaproteobacteria bacterium]|nr:YjiH family protein [Gammaproteobacteria bacterium]